MGDKIYLDEKTFREWRNLANYLKFNANYFNNVTYEEARYICNGIGAYWFPDVLRKAINALCLDLQIVAANHDLGFSLGKDNKDVFTAINEAFKTNGVKIAKYNHPWWSWKRYRTMSQAVTFAKLCQDLGWKTYINGVTSWKNTNNGVK